MKTTYRVLVRAFGDEPVVMNAVARDEETVLVSRGNPLTDTSIGWSRRNIYVPDELLVTEMERAFNCLDRKTLIELWDEARQLRIKEPIA